MQTGERARSQYLARYRRRRVQSHPSARVRGAAAAAAAAGHPPPHRRQKKRPVGRSTTRAPGSSRRSRSRSRRRAGRWRWTRRRPRPPRGGCWCRTGGTRCRASRRGRCMTRWRSSSWTPRRPVGPVPLVRVNVPPFPRHHSLSRATVQYGRGALPCEHPGVTSYINASHDDAPRGPPAGCPLLLTLESELPRYPSESPPVSK